MSSTPRQWGPNGCQFLVGGQPCGETQTLEIIQQFKRLYENKLRQIEADTGGGDNLEAKVTLQREWIRDLTQQNELLVRAVEELEQEAYDRVKMLEGKLQSTVQTGSDDLQTKLQETQDELSQTKRSMMDMRNALTIEVADKHDIILNLRRDVQQLEEQCRQANKQTQFKDDIIKELRKEIKLLKAQVCLAVFLDTSQSSHPYNPQMRSLHALDLKIGNSLDSQNLQHKTQEETIKHRPNLKKQSNKPFIFVREEEPPSNSVAQNQVNPVLVTESEDKSSQLDHIPQLEKRVTYDVPTKMLPVSDCKNKQKLMPEVRCLYENRRFFDDMKSRSKLTAKAVLHEYYGVEERVDVYGTVEDFNAIPKRSFVSVPNHVPVKTFITNLEQNSKHQTHINTKRHSRKKTTGGNNKTV